MEYYNLIGKENFEIYYRNKINGLLLNPEIMEYLDKNKIDLNEKKDLNLFPNYDKKKIRTVKTLSRLTTDGSLPPSIPMPTKKKQKFSKKETTEFIGKKITEVDSKIHKIDQKVSDEIVAQMSNFEAKKRQKKIRRKDGTITTIAEIEQEEAKAIKEAKEAQEAAEAKKAEEERKELERKKEEAENVNKDTITINEKEIKTEKKEPTVKFDIDKELEKEKENEMLTNDIEFPPRVFRRRGSSIGQNAMLKEIEEYVEKNKKEMYQALEELKLSYEPEIKEAEESGFPDIAESLKEDMSGELDNLTAQYEEQRMKEVEAIRAKYSKKETY